MSTALQCAQRTTVPGASMYTSSRATMSAVPQVRQTSVAFVISTPKSSSIIPPIALPSRRRSSATGSSETFGPDRERRGPLPPPPRRPPAPPTPRAADRPAPLEAVALARLLDGVGGPLTVLEPLDRDRQRAARLRGDRVAALRLVAVLGGQPDVEVLAGPVPGPTLRLEQERANPWRLLDRSRHLGDEPS